MALLSLILLLLAFFQDAIATEPHGISPPFPVPHENATGHKIPPPFPFPHGNATGIAEPTATGHHRPLTSATGIPHPHNGTMIDDTITDPSNAPDCIYAAKWAPYTFVECLSNERVKGTLEYTISASGTGQEPLGWAQGIWDNLQYTGTGCITSRWWGQEPKIDVTNNATFNYVIDGWSRRIMQLHGFTMSFYFTDFDYWHCHDTVKKAIQDATCPGVYVANGLACRQKGYYGDDYLGPSDPKYDHPEIGDCDDNDNGPPCCGHH
ncbi:hypothetical protein PG985_010777 [Apiospora marii]|uniref:Uncharacterized protein n=1 Tax=Apiospora marii TaxID=335849 RepID=A0ABR1T3P8_9PEZI